jgi:3,4-dihydroxybenzoate---[aryl-carrier protein] ligase
MTLFSPLPIDTPLDGARRRAERSGCEMLIVASDAESIEIVEIDSGNLRSSDALVGLIQTSSGTTGEPKFIERSWASIDTEIETYVRHFPEANEWTPIVACPVTHSYGLICGVLVALRRGVQTVIIRNLNPKFILRKLRETPESILYSSPAMIATLAMLVKNAGASPKREHRFTEGLIRGIRLSGFMEVLLGKDGLVHVSELAMEI